jgi:hypothetical protein
VSIAVYDVPFTDLEKQVVVWLEEALEARHGAYSDPEGPLSTGSDESPAEAVLFLRRIRQRADRVSELLSAATRAKARAQRAQANAAWAANRRLHEATKEHASKRGDFSSGREREAEAQLDSFEERREAHQAARLVSVTTEVYDVIMQCHRQLEEMRRDVRATLNALHFQSTLEH